MNTEELDEEVGDLKIEEEQGHFNYKHGAIAVSDAKRVLVGVAGRALFYPTLLYNVVRNKIQTEFHWWDRIDEFILLGAVPFPADVPRLKELGVSGVVTLNEPYETLVPTSLYHAHNIDHLVIPTRDYLFAPSYRDICQAVNFVHENASCGKTTYVHCKAGRGRSTTIVLCYLVEHKQMSPNAAFEYVRSIRPRVLLASSQRQAIEDYYFHKVKKSGSIICLKNSTEETVGFLAKQDEVAFDDDSAVVVTESDLDGYDASHDSTLVDYKSLALVSVASRVQFASQAAMGRLSSLWLRGNSCKLSAQKLSGKKLGSSVAATDQLGHAGVDIEVC